jgi:hypothetical protein
MICAADTSVSHAGIGDLAVLVFDMASQIRKMFRARNAPSTCTQMKSAPMVANSTGCGASSDITCGARAWIDRPSP